MRFFGKFRLTTFRIIACGFVALILTGTLLLSLPFASRKAGSAEWLDCLFTATSAVCVTGLVVQDTASFWTPFGQVVILALIQIGGMGVVTTAVSLAFLSGRKIGLMQRGVMQESISAPQLGGIVRLTRFIVLTSLGMEAAGALLLLPAMIPRFGIGPGIWRAVFHAVSAFCNAGFDLMGFGAPFSSLTGFSRDPWVNIPVMLLITAGGIGFLVWNDLKEHGFRWKQYRLQTKAALVTSACLMLSSVVGECSLALENARNAREKEESMVLAENERLRANLLRAVSHDLRTPLTSIMGNADNLLAGGESMDRDTRRRLYSDIYTDAQWLTGMVENLLSASRMEDGSLKLNMNTELMDDMIAEAVRRMGRRLDGFTLDLRPSGSLLFVQADARLIVQVIINLLDNAVKYAPAGTAITIGTREEGGNVLVSVADEGPGIPEDQKPHVFDLFWSGNNLTGDSRRGLGLGLALCQSIMKAHSGTITVRDNTPRGAVFELTFPKAEVNLDE